MTASQPGERSVFLRAIELTGPGERAAFLDAACAGDRALRAGVEALLRAHDRPQPLLDASDTPAPTTDEPSAERPGAAVGPYKLLRLIGEGGMGAVWMAEQTRPVHREVAVKVIKPGMDSRQVVARFEAERQAVALMDHPNIARVFDAGATEGGRPYFVMELVKGVPITRFCDDHHLSPRERLGLFLEVCAAVQHAHTKGVIHRDLKPSNVLVALYDDRPVPKVIDFGVAKATGPGLTERTLFTQYGQLVGTLEYMSPEQAAFNALDVDTRTDVYSLGVLLYELLSGSTPFERGRLCAAAFDEVLRIIREEEPPRPSMRLSSTAELPSIAARRRTEPARLSRSVRGDLDWIVMKAIEKDRSRRYETPRDLAADVARYLGHEPVQARPPSAWYRFGKFARRNRAALAAGAVVAGAVLAAVAGLAVSNVRISREKADKEAALAESESNLLLARQAVDEMYTDVADQLEILPHMQPYQRDVLQKALRFYQEFAQRKSTDPAVRVEAARAALRVHRIRWTLSQRAGCEPGAREVIAALEQLAGELPAGPRHRSVLAEAHHFLGVVLSLAGRHQEAEGHHRRAAELFGELAAERPDLPEHRRRLAGTRNALAACLQAQGRTRGAEECHRDAVGLCEQLAAEQPAAVPHRAELANSYYLLGHLLARTGRPREAVDVFRRTIAIFEGGGGLRSWSGHRVVHPAAHRELGLVLAAGGRAEEAERAYRRAVALGEPVAAQFPDIPGYREFLVDCYLLLCQFLARAGRPEEAVPFGRSALELTERLIAEMADRSDGSQPEDYAINVLGNLGNTLGNVGVVLRDAGQLPAAERASRKALELATKLAADSPADPGYQRRLALAHYNVGSVLLRAGRSREAAGAYRESLAVYERLAAAYPDAPDYSCDRAGMGNTLGRVLRWLPDETEAAVRHHREAVATCDALVARYPDRPRYRIELARGHYALGLDLWTVGRWAEAEAAYRQSLAASAPVTDRVAVEHRATVHNDWAWMLATCPDAKVRDPRRAVELARKAVELDPRPSYWNTLGVALYRAGGDKEALAALEKSMALGKGGDGFDWFFVAMAHRKLGHADEARKWYDRAVQWMEKKKPHDDELRRFRTEAGELISPGPSGPPK